MENTKQNKTKNKTKKKTKQNLKKNKKQPNNQANKKFNQPTKLKKKKLTSKQNTATSLTNEIWVWQVSLPN